MSKAPGICKWQMGARNSDLCFPVGYCVLICDDLRIKEKKAVKIERPGRTKTIIYYPSLKTFASERHIINNYAGITGAKRSAQAQQAGWSLNWDTGLGCPNNRRCSQALLQMNIAIFREDILVSYITYIWSFTTARAGFIFMSTS